ncbi:bifunctional lysylphosphatidylglycerol flippase/synthetase MprF [Thiorhodococcus fuscus]|uniref:Phosphatidylglycerol lysyltransferase n=1 Tax=Thiorhodococcus fuscus TaxID=527200 RepID=A0ABW4Y5D0_9GAMM
MQQDSLHGSDRTVRADEPLNDDASPEPETPQEAETGWPKDIGLVLRWLLPVLALTAVGVLGWHELRQLDIAGIHRSFQSISLAVTTALLLAGLATASLNTLYDLLLRRWLMLSYIKSSDLMRCAWVASALNNVVGFSGMTGSGIRYLGMTNAGVPPAKAVGSAALVVISMPLGLSVLATILLLAHRDMLQWTAIPEPLALSVLAAVSLYWPLFMLIAGRGPLHRRWLADTPSLGTAQRFGLVTVSTLDWIATGVLLWLCLSAAGVSLPLDTVLMAFALAMTLGLASLVPGALGVFEGAMLLILSRVGADSASVAAGLVLFRVAYYFVPFLFAAQLLPGTRLLSDGRRIEELSGRFKSHPVLRIGRIPLRLLGHLSTQILAYATFAAGVVLLLSAAFPGVTERLAVLDRFMPLLAREGFHFSSVVVGTLLLGLSRGIGAGMRGAYHATQTLLLSGSIISLLKGIDIEVAALLLVLAMLLRANRASFDRQGYALTSARNLRWIAGVSLTLLAAAGLGSVLYGPSTLLSHLDQFDHHLHSARYARALLGMAVTFLAWLAWTWYSMPKPAVDLPDRTALERAADFYTGVGHTTYSYLTMLGDKYLFYSPSGKGLIQYGIRRGHLIALGDPACDEADLQETIYAFRSFADAYDLAPVFYQVEEGHLHHYHEAGFRLLKLGESAHVSLADFTLKGKKVEQLRTVLNRAKRTEMTFEVLSQPLDEIVWDELQTISDVWLAEKHMAELGFSLGSFKRDFLAWGPIAVVRQGGALVAFASIAQDFGHHDALGIDLMRHVPNAPSGTMDFLFTNLILHAQEAGYRWFDLGMAPLSGVGRSPWSPRDERVLKLAYELGNRFYNYKGLRQYKEKFNPQWRSMYLAYPRGRPLPVVLMDITALITRGQRGKRAGR